MAAPKRVSYFWDLLYASLVAWGLWNLYKHAQHQPSISLTRIVIALAVGTFGLTINALARWGLKIARKIVATKILAMQKAIYADEPFEYRIVDPADFPHLDHEFYDSNRTWFENQGFRWLGDRQNVTLSRIIPHQTFIRAMVSADGTICGAIYHLKIPAKPVMRNFRIFELETEFGDGTFLTTSNALESARTPPVPGIDTRRYPASTSPEEMLRTHRERIAQAMVLRPSITPTRIETMEEGIAFQQRLQDVKVKHKKSIGFAGTEDIKLAMGRTLNEHEQAVAGELEKLKQTEQSNMPRQ